MEVKAHMKKALRGVPGCYSNTKRDKELSFHKFPRNASLREKFYQEKGYYSCEQHRVCMLKHSHGAKKKGTSDVPIIFSLLPQSKQRKPPKIRLPLEPPPKGRKLQLENQKPRQMLSWNK